MKPIPKNVPASVRAKLLNLSREREEDFTLTLIRYISERFLIVSEDPHVVRSTF